MAMFRRSVLRRYAFVALLASSAVPGDAFAAPEATKTSSRRVRDGLSGAALGAFDRGSTLFADGDHRGARAEFERAYELSHDPRILYNVAVCDKTMRRYVRALAALRTSLAEGAKRTPPLPESYVKTVNETIAALEPFVSKLVVTSTPEGAALLVDGEPVGTTPLAEPLAIEVGDHVVVARKSGYVEATKSVRVASGETSTASFELEDIVRRGRLVVRAPVPPPARAVVLVDGVEVGEAPLETMVEVGSHTVTVRAPGYGTAAKRVDVGARGDVEAAFTLQREVKVGRIRVRPDQDSDVVELDGRDVGRGWFEADIPAGEHRLRVRRGEAESKVIDFVLAENETRTMTVSLGKSGGGFPLVWVVAGVLAAGAVTATALVLTQSTDYQGSTPGTLAPRVVPASFWSRP